MSTMNRVAIYLGFVFFVMTAISYSNSAEAHHGKRIIVEHHYPQGVNMRHRGGHRVYRGGYEGPTTCYQECFHQGVGPRHHAPRRHHGHRGHRHRGSSVQFGISVYEGRGRRGGQGFSFRFSQHR